MNVHVKDEEGKTPLHCAAEENASQDASVLLKNGANINARDKYDRTPLHTAAVYNAAETAQMLLKSGAMVNVRDKYDNTPLHAAAETAQRMLLENGTEIEINVQWLNHGDTPLHTAARNNAAETARILLENGAKVNATDKWGRTPLRLASSPATAGVLRKYGGKKRRLRYIWARVWD